MKTGATITRLINSRSIFTKHQLVAHILKKIPIVYGPRIFIAVFREPSLKKKVDMWPLSHVRCYEW